MAFQKTASGTRGSRLGSFGGPAARWLNKQMVQRNRRKGGRASGMDVLILTTVGAKTGQRRETLLGSFPDGDAAWLVVASAAGAGQEPRVVPQPRRAPRPGRSRDRRAESQGHGDSASRRRT